MSDTVDVTLQIPKDIASLLEATKSGDVEQVILQELGVALLSRGRITHSQARRLLGVSKEDFSSLLRRRHVPSRYDVREPEGLEEVRISLR